MSNTALTTKIQNNTKMFSQYNPNTIETTNLSDLTFTVVDIETTGSKPLFHHIIEIGIVQIHKGEIIDTYETFINPGHPIPPAITMITGITDNDVEHAPLFPDIIDNILPYLNKGIFVAHNVAFDYNFIQKSLFRSGVNWHAPKLCTVQLSRKLLPHLPKHNLDAIAQHFHINIERRHRALNDAKATSIALTKMCQILIDNGLNAFSTLTKFAKRTESDKFKNLKPVINSLPYAPGVYLMKNKDGHIIYVGKSKCLHNRVRSYFYETENKSKKIQRLIEEVHSIDHIQTGSELSAMLLESQKIKEHLPVFNTMIRNYRAYPFLKFTNEPFTRIILSREVKPDGATYYGPFKSTLEVKKLIDQLQKTFGIRTCKAKLNSKKPKTFKACLDVELGNCSGACTGKMSVIEYHQHITRAQNFLEGNGSAIIKKIENQIDDASKNLEFEKAAELRDKLIILERLQSNRAKIAQAVHKNNVIIIQPSIDKTTKEAFLVKNGILLHTFQLNCINPKETNDQEGENETRWTYDTCKFPANQYEEITYNPDNQAIWQELLQNIFTQEKFPTLTKSNIDELMIIATWLMQHTEQREIFYITPNTLNSTAATLGNKYIFKNLPTHITSPQPNLQATT